VNPENLKPASYRGVEWLASASTIAGGRRGSVKRFPNSDRQVVEDLGLIPREFTLSGVVSARRNNAGTELLSYEEARDALLEALERGGTGVLVHPFFGRLENIVVRTFSFTENTARLGDSPINITFAISDAPGGPVAQEKTLGSVVSANEDVISSIEEDVGERFSVINSFIGNFQDALDKANEVVDEVNDAIQVGVVIAEELDSWTAQVAEFGANVASLVAVPTALADSIFGLFDTMKGLIPTVTGTFDAFVRLFDFGDGDTSFPLTTPGREERQENRDVLNAAVRGLALGHAYEQAARLDLQNVDDVEEVAAVLEAQYQSLIAADILASEVEEEITQERIVVTEFFDELRVSKPRILEVETNFTTTPLLAYQYYGSSELGETIAELNGLRDMVGVKGTVRILTA
jgi:hypothetical protein